MKFLELSINKLFSINIKNMTKRIDDNSIDNNSFNLNIFNKLNLFNCQKINKIFDKSISFCDKLKKELSKLSSNNNSSIIDSFSQEKNYNTHKIDKFMMNIKLTKNINFQFNRKLSEKSTKKRKIFFSFEKMRQQKKNANKKEELTILSPKSTLFNNNKSNKRKNNEFKQIKNRIFNKNIKNNILGNSKKIKSNNNILSYNDNINKYRKINNFKAFIPYHRTGNNFFHKKKSIIYSYKDTFKDILNKNLSQFINESKSLYNSQISKLINKNDSLISGRKKYYKIKYLLTKFDMGENIGKELGKKIKEDFDFQTIHKKMKLFSQSFKGKIILNKNDITKSVMITKKNADIINFCDYFSKMDNLVFYKLNKSFIHNYPILSQNAREDTFERSYKKISYISHKKNLERNIKIDRTGIKL